jgi:hypothetical protein
MSCSACQKARSLASSLGAWAKAGMPIASQETLLLRLETCKACEHFKNGFCGKCGCVMLAKARMATAKCPDGKW